MSVMNVAHRGVIAESTFGPASIPGLFAWYKASAITGLTDGAAVATWADQSGNGRDLAQATSGMRPLYKTSILNGKSVVRFDGVDDLLDTASFTLAQPCTVFYAYVPRNLAALYTIFDTPSGTAMINYWTPSGSAYHQSTGSTDIATPYTTTVNAGDVIGNVFNGTSSVFTRNGAATTTSPGTSGFTAGLRVGNSRSGFNFPGQIDVAEFLIYNSALSSTNRRLVEAYLGRRYGITVV